MEARWPNAAEVPWMSPEELVQEGLQRSRVLMMNEARRGKERSVRARRMGARVLPMARAMGAQLLALESVKTDQADLQHLIAEAERQGLRVAAYDVEEDATPIRLRTKVKTPAFTNWRDGKQAANLAALFQELAEDGRMMVWCPNLHHSKVRFMQYRPMGWRFQEATGAEPFSIDQAITVNLMGHRGDPMVLRWARRVLEARGGEAGYVWREGLPRLSPGVDAWLLSLDNSLS